LQVLFTESEEFGIHKGLDIVPGRVRRFPIDRHSAGMVTSSGTLKIPHMGWNSIDIVRSAPLFNGVGSGSHCYFVHSYFVEPKDPGVVASVTDYGGQFVSAIWRDNVVACQFHPEKSQTIGLQVIKNFAAWAL
jgi:glutamine amidotransferase